MRFYRVVLLSTDNSLIESRQMEEKKNRATIVNGLGETEVPCEPCKRLKSLSFSRLFQNVIINSRNEVFDVSQAIEELFENAQTQPTCPMFIWLRTTVNLRKAEQGLRNLFAYTGVGGVRQTEKALMIRKFSAFIEKVQQLIRAEKSNSSGGSDVNIHIFTGVGGETREGTFLDVCYRVKQILKNMGEWEYTLNCGDCFFPYVNLNVAQISESPAISKYIKKNIFAIMNKQDFCMNFVNNGEEWNQQYMRSRIRPTNELPAKISYFISKENI